MTPASQRPRSLGEVSRRVMSGEAPFDYAVREFLDSFYARPETRQAAIAEAPERLEPVHDAYLAAVAEHLAHVYGLAVPAWAETRGFDLKRPFFAGGLESLKARLLVESPAAFRRRMLFVGMDALSRPHSAAGMDVTQNTKTVGRSP